MKKLYILLPYNTIEEGLIVSVFIMAESINGKLVAIVRIRGKVKISYHIEETLMRLRLNHVNHCTIIKFDDSYKGMIKKVQNHVAYGEVSNEMFEKLITKHMPGADPKEFLAGNKLKEMKEAMPLKLHPPRHGYKSTLTSYNQGGSLGYHKGTEIDDLLKRMN